jgi:hypothetical protein
MAAHNGVLDTNYGLPEQGWTYRPDSNGAGHLVADTTQCLSAPGSSEATTMAACADTASQRWYPVSNSDGTVTLKTDPAVGSNSCLDVYSQSDSDGATIGTYGCNGGNNQKFHTDTAPEATPQVTAERLAATPAAGSQQWQWSPSGTCGTAQTVTLPDWVSPKDSIVISAAGAPGDASWGSNGGGGQPGGSGGKVTIRLDSMPASRTFTAVVGCAPVSGNGGKGWSSGARIIANGAGAGGGSSALCAGTTCTPADTHTKLLMVAGGGGGAGGGTCSGKNGWPGGNGGGTTSPIKWGNGVIWPGQNGIQAGNNGGSPATPNRNGTHLMTFAPPTDGESGLGLGLPGAGGGGLPGGSGGPGPGGSICISGPGGGGGSSYAHNGLGPTTATAGATTGSITININKTNTPTTPDTTPPPRNPNDL